jgi:hypothetical protein
LSDLAVHRIPALAAYAAGPTVRRNAFTMAENDPILKGYRKAIIAMKALPTDDPCSWTYQAAIHGTTLTPAQTGWNTCHIDARFFGRGTGCTVLVRTHRPKAFRMYDGDFIDWPTWRSASCRRVYVVGSAQHPSRNAAMNDGTGSISTAHGRPCRTQTFPRFTMRNPHQRSAWRHSRRCQGNMLRSDGRTGSHF